MCPTPSSDSGGNSYAPFCCHNSWWMSTEPAEGKRGITLFLFTGCTTTRLESQSQTMMFLCSTSQNDTKHCHTFVSHCCLSWKPLSMLLSLLGNASGHYAYASFHWSHYFKIGRTKQVLDFCYHPPLYGGRVLEQRHTAIFYIKSDGQSTLMLNRYYNFTHWKYLVPWNFPHFISFAFTFSPVTLSLSWVPVPYTLLIEQKLCFVVSETTWKFKW